MVSRRAFLETGLTGFLTISLLDALMAGDAVPAAVDPILKGWLRDLHERCGDLRGGAIPATAWQSEVTALLEKVPLDDLLRLIDFDQMLKVVPGLDPARPTEFMDYVDPRRAESIGDGTLRAPRLGQDEVFKRYGNTGV